MKCRTGGRVGSHTGAEVIKPIHQHHWTPNTHNWEKNQQASNYNPVSQVMNPGPPVRGQVTVPRSPAGLRDLMGYPDCLSKSQGRRSHPGLLGRFCETSGVCTYSVCDIRLNTGDS